MVSSGGRENLQVERESAGSLATPGQLLAYSGHSPSLPSSVAIAAAFSYPCDILQVLGV